MKTHLHILTSAATASFLVLTSLAQETTNQTGTAGEYSHNPSTNYVRTPAQQGNELTLNAERTNQIANPGTNAITDANNSARNERDRNSQTLTPLDQGNNSADLATTKQIRKEIIATKDISVSARNVKIITANGRVTLRGPVQTEQEKQLIGEIAAKIAQPKNVDNQLEPKMTPTGRN
jgi:hypothetical protein